MKTDKPILQQHIRNLRTPFQAKREGAGLTVRPDWDNIKLAVMQKAVRAKFEQNQKLLQKLQDTGDEIIQEGNNWGDVFWGIHLKTGKGENHLGKIIMKIRKELCKK